MNTIPTYIVTGASRGIGRAVATALAKRDFRVIATGRSKDLLNSLAEERANVTVVSADLVTPAGIQQVAACIEAESEIAGIVHSAGSLVPLEAYNKIDSSELAEHFRIHVGAPIALFQAVNQSHSIKRMMFIDSYSATTERLGWAAYSIVKAAAQMAARCAMQELPETRSIRVFPGAVNTQIVESVLASDTETATTFAGMLERGEFAEPDEVAQFLIALLVKASDELLGSREAFDYNNSTDRSDVSNIG